MQKKTTAKRSLGQEELNNKIRETAQRLFKKKGSLPGHDLDNWLEAEKIVKKKCL